MKQPNRTVRFDDELQIEAYRFTGLMQKFPWHFHEHYVIGLIEAGTRKVDCCGRTYTAPPGTLVIFHPGDTHGCTAWDDEALDYCSLNIPQPVMRELAREITGRDELPGFQLNIIEDSELVPCFRALHQMVMSGSREFEKEELLLLLLGELIGRYGQPFASRVPECRAEVARVCALLDERYAEPISLDQLCRCAGLSKSTLLRAFTKSHGVTPYRYLETVRINQAKKLLEQGVCPADAALRTGFSDQSHFTNYFSRFTGVAPGAYRDIFMKKTGGDSHEL